MEKSGYTVKENSGKVRAIITEGGAVYYIHPPNAAMAILEINIPAANINLKEEIWPIDSVIGLGTQAIHSLIRKYKRENLIVNNVVIDIRNTIAGK